MTDQEKLTRLEELVSRADDVVTKGAKSGAAIAALAGVELTRDSFIRWIANHSELLYDHNDPEVRQIIREVHNELRATADRLTFISKEGGK